MLGSFSFYIGVAVTAILCYIIMACLSEDGKWEDQPHMDCPSKAEELPNSKELILHWPRSTRGKVYRSAYAAIRFLKITVKEMYLFFYPADGPVRDTIISRMVSRLVDWIVCKLEGFKFMAEAKTMMELAHSRTHFSVLMEKRTLGMSMKFDETEVESYNSLKQHMGERWPFMWEVTDVTKPSIGCSGFDCIPMSSYSYLDLIRDQRVQNYAIACASEWSSGNHGPRMLGGNMKILRELELRIGKFFGRDDSLVLSAGFLATMSSVAGVASENDIIFADSWLHASLRTGLKISTAKVVYFKHNRFDILETLMKKERKKYRNAWIVVESVYSMDGDICDLPAANKVAKIYNAKIIIDEAHGLGVVGKTGRGIEEHFGLQGCATLICGTFSKSISSVGGYITGSKDWISFLDFHAPGNVFSAPLSAYHAGAAMKSFQIIAEEPELVKKAHENSAFLRQCLTTGLNMWPADYPQSSKYVVGGDPATTVIPVIFPDDIDRVVRVATGLKQRGYMVSAVAYPACHLRRPRFRITATTAYSKEVMVAFTKALVEACLRERPSESVKLMSILGSAM